MTRRRPGILEYKMVSPHSLVAYPRRRPGVREHKMVSPKSIVVCTRRGGRVEPDFSFGIPEDILQMLSDLYSARTPEELEAVREKYAEKAPMRKLTR